MRAGALRRDIWTAQAAHLKNGASKSAAPSGRSPALLEPEGSPMFDIKWIRDNAAAFDASLKRRGLEPLSGKLIELDEDRRATLTRLQDAQARRNAASKEIGKAKASKDEAGAAKLMAEVATLKEVIRRARTRSVRSTRRWRRRWPSSPTCRWPRCRTARMSTTTNASARSARRRRSISSPSSISRSAKRWASWTSRARPRFPAPGSCS